MSKKPEKKKNEAESEGERSEENMVFIGRKPTMQIHFCVLRRLSYVLACVIQFNQGAKEVIIVARGRAISKAVDVAEIVRQRFLPEGVKLGKITTGTEIIGTGDDKRNVSTIEIQLLKA